jgi:hypothetical protein
MRVLNEAEAREILDHLSPATIGQFRDNKPEFLRVYLPDHLRRSVADQPDRNPSVNKERVQLADRLEGLSEEDSRGLFEKFEKLWAGSKFDYENLKAAGLVK